MTKEEAIRCFWYFSNVAGSGKNVVALTRRDKEAFNVAIEALSTSEIPNKWIPVSERLPEICEKDCHGDITFSKTVITTQIYGNGYAYVGIDRYTTNNGGGWLSEVPFDNPDECCKVIAWMPLPEPYKAESEED